MQKDLVRSVRLERDRLNKVLQLLEGTDQPQIAVSTSLNKPTPVKLLKPTAPTVSTDGGRAPRGQVKEDAYVIVARAKGKPVAVASVVEQTGKPYSQVYLTMSKDSRLKKVGKALFAIAGVASGAGVVSGASVGTVKKLKKIVRAVPQEEPEEPSEEPEEPEEPSEDTEMVEFSDDAEDTQVTE